MERAIPSGLKFAESLIFNSPEPVLMKIAIVHNDYGMFSGEEAVVRDHAALLSSLGHEIIFFRRSSAELKSIAGNVKGFLCGIWNPTSRRKFASFLDKNRPDLVHIHNLYPLINPCILPEAKERHIPVVMTLHNFRLFCPNGLFSVNNRICEKCAQQGSVLPCLRNNCLGSRFKTLGYALRTKVAQYFRWYLDNVDLFLCLTEFQRDKLAGYGLQKNKCRVVPNFIDAAWLERAVQSPPGSKGYVAYMGRLSEEKGIDLLLDAARKLPDIPFKIAGNGAEKFRRQAPVNVEFLGYLTGDAQFEFMRNAKLQVMSSRWYEIFPTTLLQGMSLGVPAIVPDLGGMPGIVGRGGVAFVGGNAHDLSQKIEFFWHDEAECRNAAMEAQYRVKTLFAPAVVGKLLWKHYSSLLVK